MTLVAALGVAAFAGVTRAAQVAVDLTALRTMQTYALEDGAPDEAYLVLSGVAKGAELPTKKFPDDGTWKISPKEPAVDGEEPKELWSGDLAEGEFALLTVTLFQGKGDEATLKAYMDKKGEAEKGVALRSAKKMTADDAKKLSAELLKAHRDVVIKVKDIVGGRDKNTDHFGGQFTLLLWNEGGKIQKRLDPVGLTFGEHDGIDAKVYSKLKFTLQNVLMKDEAGDLVEEQLLPLNEDEDAIRVKMLETEFVKKDGKSIKNVTDYLAEIQVKAAGKPLYWRLDGEHTGIDDIHHFWDFAR